MPCELIHLFSSGHLWAGLAGPVRQMDPFLDQVGRGCRFEQDLTNGIRRHGTFDLQHPMGIGAGM